jgi:inosose dehydratase
MISGFPITGPYRFASAMNAWKPGFMGFARREEHERGFKTVAAAGFRAVELKAGSGRWDPLGRPEGLAGSYGSVQGFREQLRAWGIHAVSSYYWDPLQMSFEDLHFGLDPLNDAHRDAIVSTARLYAECLAALGGDLLVVRPAPSYWKTGELSAAQCTTLAATWSSVGEAIAAHGVRVGLHLDALSSLRRVEAIEQLLGEWSPAYGGLAFDSAELALQGHDPVELFRRLAPRIVHVHLKNLLVRDDHDEYREKNAERVMLQAGGRRGVERWFAELGHPQGLLDLEALTREIARSGYGGWIVAESDGGPAPVASGVLLNAWFLLHRLLPLLPSSSR